MDTLNHYESLAESKVNTKEDDCLEENIVTRGYNRASPGLDRQQIRCCRGSGEFCLLVPEPVPVLLVHG